MQDIPANSFIADVGKFEAEFLDTREINGQWYCIVSYGGQYIAGEGYEDKETAWNLAIHDVLLWLHCLDVQFDALIDETDEKLGIA